MCGTGVLANLHFGCWAEGRGQDARATSELRVKVALGGDFGDGGYEGFRVGILGLRQDFGGGAEFDELAGAHNGNAGGQLSYDGQGMRNEDVGEI